MEIVGYDESVAYVVKVSIYVARITTLTAAILAFVPVVAALRICWDNRKLPLSSIVSALKPFDITVLFRGILLCCMGAAFGGVTFTALDAMYVPTTIMWRVDLAVAIVWSLWGAGIVSIASAFSDNPRKMYLGMLIFITGSMMLALWSGRLG